MEPIREGQEGAAVKDIQTRLLQLGYAIDDQELAHEHFSHTTAEAVVRFRLSHNLSLAPEVDQACWSALVDACYTMGDRTLYLRLPYFHGNDVYQLQRCLNILGFCCGDEDGYFGAHTESAVKEFQESQGSFGDGMVFQDTFDAIERLHHVWEGKKTSMPQTETDVSFTKAQAILERLHFSLAACDPISRNIAGRIWNLAQATSEKNGIELVEDKASAASKGKLVITLTCAHEESPKTPTLSCENIDTLPKRLKAACAHAHTEGHEVVLELPQGLGYDGTFTTEDAQTFAVVLLDALCSAFGEE